jgi:hypothetical protein
MLTTRTGNMVSGKFPKVQKACIEIEIMAEKGENLSFEMASRILFTDIKTSYIRPSYEVVNYVSDKNGEMYVSV